MPSIILTGGGTAGHVTPHLALIPRLKRAGYNISYIGSYNGIEKDLIEKENIDYYGISSGKLRRYFNWKNFTDPFRVLRGYFQSRKLMRKLKPDIIFSKGGFVSVPVVLAAKSKKVPVIIHESDMTPGLANKLAFRGATKICCNFPETLKYLPEEKAVLTGSPIRQQLMRGNRDNALKILGFSGSKPVLMIMGGSIGSVFINNSVRDSLDVLQKRFDIIHLCGKGNLEPSLDGREGYRQFEYISKELPDFFAACDIIISRAGANSICELLALRKPNILIPLSKNASRGDQILNANSFKKQGFSLVIEEEDVTADLLVKSVNDVFDNKEKYISAMEKSPMADSVSIVMDLIKSEGSRK